MPFPLAGIIGGMIATRAGHAVAGGFTGTVGRFLKSPIIQGGQFGVGYTSGAYGGYGVTNTADPLGLHKPKYKYSKAKLGLPYGSYGYGRRRYRRRYGYSRYSRYSSYRRRRPYYRRSYY